MKRLLRQPFFKFFSSLKLAVFVLLSVSAVLGTATVLESEYGTRAVYLLVYGTWWFYGLLFLLGTNVLCAALSRYPWKRHQIGFVVTHSGILTILLGSYLTMKFGVDGNLPVVEGDQDGKVILSGLTLSVTDEDAGAQRAFPVPEDALARKGDLMEVAFQTGDKLVATQWIPRAVMQQQFERSPAGEVGSPAVHLEIYNSRFHVDEWLLDQYPGKGAELNLGPAVLRFRKLWSADEEKAFLAPAKKVAKKESSVGYLIFEVRGKTYRLPVESALRTWRRLGSEDLQVRIENYLPYAIVREGKLVTKSDQPVNPAVQLLLRNGRGVEEKHSVFAVFPEFSTIHKGHSKGGGGLGVKVRMVSSASKGAAEESQERGRLELAQSSDDKRLFFRVFARSGDTNASGEIAVGKDVATGWMDLHFVVRDWFAHAVSLVRPQYVEKVAGTDNNFLASLYVEPRPAKGLASSGAPAGFWLTEGENRIVPLGGRKVVVGLTRQNLQLPFELFLEKFTIGNDPGTTKAATYESRVKMKDARTPEQGALISMNEPLHHGGYTFYQASYQLREGQPPISVFSVNFDPGRLVKYLGSLIMVLGIAVMFWMNPHYWNVLLGSRGRDK